MAKNAAAQYLLSTISSLILLITMNLFNRCVLDSKFKLMVGNSKSFVGIGETLIGL